MSSEDDPLTGADIGETRRDEHTVTLSTVTYTPNEWYSDDRTVEMEIADVEVVDSEHPDDPKELEVTYAAELTKKLPRKWDACREPLTEAERRREQKRQWRQKWGRRVSVGIGFLIPAVVATFVTNSIMSRLAREGPFEEVAAPGLGEIAGMVALLMLFTAFVMWAIQRLPRPGPGRTSL